MDELEDAQEWATFWRLKHERAEADIREMEDTIDDLKTRLILRQEELLALYRR